MFCFFQKHHYEHTFADGYAQFTIEDTLLMVRKMILHMQAVKFAFFAIANTVLDMFDRNHFKDVYFKYVYLYYTYIKKFKLFDFFFHQTLIN